MMLISRFNTLIRNRIVWGVFAVLVVLSFVVWQTQTPTEDESRAGAPGLLDGKPVPDNEWRSAYFNAYLSMSLMVGSPLTINARVDAGLRKLAWRRLVALRAARAARLEVAPAEIIEAIQTQPLFQSEGRFSPERYAGFLRQFLSGLNASERQFEDYIRQELLLAKARTMVGQGVWVAPLEVQEVFHQLYDTFVVSYVPLRAEELAHHVRVSEADATAYFEAHREDFAVPEMRRVKVAAFPFECFVDEGALDEAALRAYYDDHIEDFTVKGADGLLTAPTFEELADSLRDRVALEVAVTTAGDRAVDFEVALAPDRRGQAPSFEDAARAGGIPVQTTDVFTRTGAVTGLAVGPDFNEAAFRLRNTPDDYFSHPVRGSNAYYVLAYDSRSDRRLPAFEEVREAVSRVAHAAAVSNWLARTAADVHRAAADGMRRGLSFAESVRPFGLEVFTTDPFSARTGIQSESDDTLRELTRAVLVLNAGELAGPLAMEDGQLVGHVDARVTADRLLFDSIHTDLARYVRQRREETAFQQWQESLLASHRFQETARPAPEAGPDEDAQDSESDDEAAGTRDGGTHPGRAG